MNNRTRKGARTLRGSGIMTAIKKPIYGSKNPIYKLDVSQSIVFDKNKYEVAGLISHDVGEFSFIRAQSYIDQYLKKEIIAHALHHYSDAAKIVGYRVIHRKTKVQTPMYVGSNSKNIKGSCMPVQCLGSYTIIGLVLRPSKAEPVSAGTRRLTMSRGTKSKTKTH